MQVHDEVCGMTIDSDNAAANRRFQGVTYYFCSDRCVQKFIEHPDWYVKVVEEDESGDPRASDSVQS
jgi:YHS domain-containing protein